MFVDFSGIGKSDNWSGEDYRNGKCIHRENQIIVQGKNKQLLNYGKTSLCDRNLLQIQRKIKLIDNWSNKTETYRHRIQRTAGEVLEPANNSLVDSR